MGRRPPGSRLVFPAAGSYCWTAPAIIMPVIAPKDLRSSYDVVIVGSGAGGGQMAYTLTMEGIKVLVLEAGRMFDPTSETAMMHTPDMAPLRGEKTPDKQYGFYDASVESGWDIPGEPYTQASKESLRQFAWWRQRMMGGRTNHWGRVSLRNGPYDFKTHSRLGVGLDWPMTYEDLAPWYDKAEMLVGIFGDREGIENSPDSSPGVLLPPPKFRAGELLARERARRLGIAFVPVHRAILTRAQDATRVPKKLHPGNPKAQRLLAENMGLRLPCIFATDCHRGCAIKAAFDSTSVYLTPALKSGNLEILPNAMAREVTLDRSGKASGVTFIDKTTGMEHHAKGRVVVIAAGSQESVRLLLNSRSNRFPDGLANSSGKVGKYITDSVASSVSAQIPALENLPVHNEDGTVGQQAYAPWWLAGQQEKLDFSGGYKALTVSGRKMPGLSTGRSFDRVSDADGIPFGRKLKEDARRYYGSFQGIGAQGAMAANDDCFSELDPEVKDKWGIPVLRFHWKWSADELRQVAHQQKSMAEILEAMGGRFFSKPHVDDPEKAIKQGGQIIHEVGGAIMGGDPTKSVTNQWCQTWDVPNLIMADGATFPGTADKNPTLTIMAVAYRAADHLIGELKKGNL
jgi:choline dehydrogenase-like flavoprotein